MLNIQQIIAKIHKSDPEELRKELEKLDLKGLLEESVKKGGSGGMVKIKKS